MSMLRAVLAVAVVTACPLILKAQEKYALKLSRADKTGARQAVTRAEKLTADMVAQDGIGKALRQEKETGVLNEAYVETVVSKVEGKPPDKLKRRYDKFTYVKNGSNVNVGLAGKTVVIQRGNNGVQFRFENGSEVTGEALENLQDEFPAEGAGKGNTDEAILPNGLVAVGDSWKCNAKDFIGEFSKEATDIVIDETKSKATGKLVRVYQKDGHSFGVIEATAEAPIKSIGPPESRAPAATGSAMRIKLTYDGCIDGTQIDGSTSIVMDMKATGSFKMADGRKVVVRMTGKANSDTTHKAAK
jgi:hypothetical protein